MTGPAEGSRRRRDTIKSTSEGWRTCHVAVYAATGVLGLTSSVVFYLAVVRSGYRCYQYNAVLMIHERSRDEYEPRVADPNAWYRSRYCSDTIGFSLHLTVFSAVAMAMCLVFGRGGTETSDLDHTVYFSIVGHWRMVFWACLFNFWYMQRSFIIALQLTDGYNKFSYTVSQLPADDRFRNEFENAVQPYYVASIMLFWSLAAFCALNFILMIYRCVTGVDFEAEFNNDLEDGTGIESAGPSNNST